MRLLIGLVTVVATLIGGTAALADPSPPPDGWPPIDGTVGLETADGHGWLAVKVEIPDSCAMSGISWYNNDEMVVFSTVGIATGHEDGPRSLGDAVVVAEAVSGGSTSWSRCEFELPVAAMLGSLYVVLEFPAGSGYEFPGGGGTAPAGGVLVPWWRASATARTCPSHVAGSAAMARNGSASATRWDSRCCRSSCHTFPG